MKNLLSLLLPLALLLSLTACGEKSADEAARQTPPTLTVTGANACSVTLKSSSYDWTYTQGLQSMTVIACGAHPLDETSRDITPVLEMPFAVSAAYFYTVTLDFGDNSPDSVSLRCWPSDAWGSTGIPSETVTAQRQDNGTFRAELPQSDGIFAVDALWDGSSATYTFCTQAEGSEELHPGAVLSIGESEDIRKIDISWRSGSVNIYTAEQSAQISVKEESTAPLAESEKMVCAIDGDTLRIHFLGDAYRGSYDGEKYLDVGLPRELVSAGHFEEIKVETTDAYTIVGADVSGSIKLSTVGGDARVMGATCPMVEIETVNGSVGVVDGTWARVNISTLSGAIELAGEAENAEIETASGKVDIAGALGTLDFESVSGNLILATERALRLDAETESGSIYLTLPAQDGFTLDYETKSGAFRSALTEREGTLIACGDRETHYTVPALDGGAVFVDLFGLAYELVNGSGVGEGAFGVEPPLLHAKDRIAANFVRIGCKQRVVETLQLGCRGNRAALNHASQRGVREQAASQHYMARAGISLHQRIHILKIENVAVIGYGERRAFQRLAVKLLARRSRIAVLLHAWVHDQPCQRHAAIQIEHTLVFVVALKPQPGLDRYRQR